MFPHLSTTARAVTFFLLATGMCSALAVLAPNGEGAAIFAMLTPTIAVVLMNLVVTRDGWTREGWSSLGTGRLGLRFWPIAVGLPLIVLAASESLVRLTGLTDWHLPDLSDLLSSTAANLPILFALVLGEEVGWRGYLSPLLARDGHRAPLLRTGLLHGLWHLPVVFLASGAYLVDGSRWVVVPVFLAVLTCAGVVYGRLRELSGSVYPAVLLHMAFNFGLGLAEDNVTTTAADMVAQIGREGGIITLTVLVLATVWFVWRYPTPVTTPARVLPETVRAVG